MFSVRQSIFIHAPQQEVFDLLTDTSRAAEWQTSLQGAQSQGDAGLSDGTSVSDSRNWLGLPLESRYEVIEHQPPNRVRVRVTEGPVPLDFTWTLEAVEDGTRLTGEGAADHWPGPHADEFAARAADHGLAADLAVLRALIEQPTARSS